MRHARSLPSAKPAARSAKGHPVTRLAFVLLSALVVPGPVVAADDDAALAARGRALYQGHAAFARGSGVTALRPAGVSSQRNRIR